MPISYYSGGSLVIGTLDEYIAEIEQRYKDLYGDNIRTGAQSVFGQHARLKAELLADLAALMGYVAAQSNPETANGAALSEALLFNGITRNAKQYSTVTLECGADAAGATIPAGTQVSDGAGTIFAIDSETVVAPNDIELAPATAVEEGAITAEAGTLTTIEQPVYGWASVTNPLAAVVGNLEESDPAAKARRRAAAVGVGGGSASYVEKKLRDIDNVTDVSVYVDYSKHAHIVVEGGTDADIATTLHRSVGAGTVYEGTTIVNYTDADTGQDDTIRFYRAVEKPIYITLYIEKLMGYAGAGGDDLVRQRVLDYFAGELEVEGENQPRPRLGETVTVGKVSLGPDTVDKCFVRSALIGFDASPTSAEDLSMERWWRPSTSADKIVIMDFVG